MSGLGQGLYAVLIFGVKIENFVRRNRTESTGLSQMTCPSPKKLNYSGVP
jgi:hypothetical protein